jgi:hypothetical protein
MADQQIPKATEDRNCTEIAEKPVEQEAFGNFEVRCQKCGSLRVEWVNTIGYSKLSGGWGEAGFKCRDCGATTDMIEG